MTVAVAKKINEKYGKAVYFENVKELKYPVFTYALANRDGIAAALNMEPTQMTHQWSRRQAALQDRGKRSCPRRWWKRNPICMTFLSASTATETMVSILPAVY